MPTQEDAPAALPDGFLQRMDALLGPEAADLAAALEGSADAGLRVNTRKLAPEAFPERVPWSLRAIPWCRSGYVAEQVPDRPGWHPLHLAGVFYVQDPSAMAVAEALSAQPGEWVADLAAAPGGKATRLVEQIGADGLLLANDVHPERALALGRNLERWGADNAVLARAPVAELAAAWGPVFDHVLLDAPCSGEGMFRKSPEARAMWSAGTVRACATRQSELLSVAAAMVAPGGRLVYSTCTFAPEENEAVIAAFLRERPEFEVEPIRLSGTSPGRPEWVTGGAPPELAGAVRLWPHLQPGEGHFAARLRRTSAASDVEGAASIEAPDAPAAPRPEANREGSGETQHRAGSAAPVHRPPPAATELRGRELDLVRTFFAETLHQNPYDGRAWLQAGGQVYALPYRAPRPLARGVVRPGLALGTLRKNRFEPAHALAMAVDPSLVRRRVELPADAPDLAAYLQGLELAASGPDGWLLVCVDGFPLGWGRRVKGVVRNAYPKGLRIR